MDKIINQIYTSLLTGTWMIDYQGWVRGEYPSEAKGKSLPPPPLDWPENGQNINHINTSLWLVSGWLIMGGEQMKNTHRKPTAKAVRPHPLWVYDTSKYQPQKNWSLGPASGWLITRGETVRSQQQKLSSFIKPLWLTDKGTKISTTLKPAIDW